MKLDVCIFVSVFKVCGRLVVLLESFISLYRMDWLYKVKRLYCEVVMVGYELNVFLWSIFVYIYVNCGFVSEVWCVFDMMVVCSVVLWNTMIVGYVKLE